MQSSSVIVESGTFKFRAESTPLPASSRRPWRILSVDDDVGFQASLSHALEGKIILGRPIELVLANSMGSAAHLLANDRNFAVILVDVVMETEDAGLRLAKGVREMLGLQEMRIVLLTGQPGFAPIDDVMSTYDLSDYCLKSDLGSRGLTNVLTAAIRSFDQLSTVSAARRGLQLIIEASNRFSAARSIQEIATAVLIEVASLLGVSEDGIVAARGLECTLRVANHDTAIIVGAAGRFADHVNHPVAKLPDSAIADALATALAHRKSIAADTYQVLYFPRQHALAEYAIFLDTGRSLENAERELLAVFAANASKGFGNIALVSRLDRLAYEDELLGIANRSALLREIDRLKLTKGSTPNRLILVDLDNFSGFNEAFGSTLGDALLKAAAARLAEYFPPPCFLARIFADTFAILGPADKTDAHTAPQAITQHLVIGEQSFRFSACCGDISLDATDVDGRCIVRAATSTLRQAKSHGPGSIESYSLAVEHAAGERYEMMSQLAHAIEANDLFLMFQPQIDLQSGRLIGTEALLRWKREDGFVPPGLFIPLAEKSSYIHAIGAIVITQATAALKRLAEAGLEHVVVSINISPRQFEDPSLVGELLGQLARDGVPVGRLGIEVTETTAMENFSQVTGALDTFREAGGTVAIDDFGTGMASLEYVSKLPADHIKIDRAFVDGIGTDKRHEAILQIILELGRVIGAKLIAEGVETESQAVWLREHGCHIAQGWHFGRPMPLDDLIGQFGDRNVAA